MEDGTISTSKPKVRKVESDEEDSELDCYGKSEGKPVHVDIDKEDSEGDSTVSLLQNRSKEDQIDINREIICGNGTICVRRSNPINKPTERLGSVAYFWTHNSVQFNYRTNL